MPLGYLQKPDEWGVEWRAVLSLLAARQRLTPREAATELCLGKDIETVEYRGSNRREVRRIRNTGPSEANVRLRRLASWGMAYREKGRGGQNVYVISPYGLEVDKNPPKTNRKAKK